MLRSSVVRAVSAVGKRSLVFRTLSTASSRSQISAVASQNPEPRTVPRPVEEMPGPKHYPFIGCLPTMMTLVDVKELHKFFFAMYEQYGPIFRLATLGSPPMVVVVDADEFKRLNQITQADPIRPPMESLQMMREKHPDNFFEGKLGIVNENGEEWWRVRSKVQTPVMKPKLVSLYIDKMDQVSLDFLDRIAMFQAEMGEMPTNFQTELYKWALESVGLVAINRRLGCLDPDLSPDSDQMRLINIVNHMFISVNKLEFGTKWWKVFPSPTFNKLMEGQEEFLSILLPTIADVEARLQKEAVPDEVMPLLETLLLTPGLSHKDVITFMLDFFSAGIDTTSHSVGFVLYLLARNPEVQRRLQEEVDEVLGDETGPLTEQHLAKLRYLKAVVKEALRIFPLAGGFARTLKEDMEVRGFNVPAGYVVISLSMITGWQESHFPRATEFLPERWLRDRPLGPIHPYASLPFGVGPRMCPGRRIAEQETYTLLARMAQRFTVDYKYEDIGIECQMVFKPSKPLRFTFMERR